MLFRSTVRTSSTAYGKVELTVNVDGTLQLNNCTSRSCLIGLIFIVLLLPDLQSTHRLELLSWEERKTGPSHMPEWNVTCKRARLHPDRALL